ncbi:type IV pilus biogenesis/stability protein PilW [Chitinimonas arctica]|uniref:Type IV pilus biogenesis/stability protein PilW n=1 Tax=Chitinimonas arctica TaxID=2594795 RepID=A0A516SJ81_9NEIS|nr:type IV pilus biogenesis/stability protein PilW [Chitinimonas arctica]QDQ28193.1 type IV pilus biogenesis/stability protein PilW [Chitinimonas arctica]
MRQSVIAALLFVLSLSAVRAEEVDRRHELAKLRTELAAAYYARGQYGVALEELKNALNARSDYAMAYSIQGLVYMDLREYDTADKSFQRALSLAPNDADVNHNYGWFLCNKRDKFTESLRYFTTAMKNPLYTTPEKSMQQAGLCATKAGDLKAAEDYLRKSDRIQPDDTQTLLGLAQLAYRRGEFEATRQLLARHARLGTPIAEALWLNVRVDRKLGSGEADSGFAKELKTRFPDSDEARRLAAGQFD